MRKQPSDDEIVTITYLEMDERPSWPLHSCPRTDVTIIRANQPSLGFYRFLYDTVGDPWWWMDRRSMDQEELRRIIQDDRVAVHVLYVGGTPAGYVELDDRSDDWIEIAYFGLMPDYIGLGIGGWFLRWAVDEAWKRNPKKLAVNTCNLDHNAALPLYQKVGFRPVRRAQKPFAYAPG